MRVIFTRLSLRIEILLLLTFFAWVSAFSQQYGLSFHSHDVLKDQRTGIVLTPEKDFTFNKEFELSYDLSTRQLTPFRYGYVFRIILNGKNNIDLLYGNRSDEERDFTIVEGNRKSEIAFNVDPALIEDNWINFRIKFLLEEDKLIFYEQDNVLIDSSIDLEPKSRVFISFGACSREDFISADVPPIRIRDIKLFAEGKLQNHWPLNETEGEDAFDMVRRKSASVKNPDWIRYRHLHWNMILELNFRGNVQLTENPVDEKIYWVGEDFLVVYDAAQNLFDTVYYPEKPGFFSRKGQAIFDPLNGQIISYNLDSKQIFTIDPLTGEIGNNELMPYTRKEFLHHNKHFNEADSSIYIFHGYGHYMYRNSVLRCNINNRTWEELNIPGDKPEPRYLTASGFLGDTVYLLGGYGSESGRQMLSPIHFYDLYAFSPKDLKFIKKDSFPKPAKDYCFANSLVIDPLTRSYYALAFPDFMYNSQLQLLKGSLDRVSSDGDILEKMGDRIPYSFNDINSYADLYYFPEAEKMYAVTLLSNEQSESKAILYSIGFPPIPESTIEASQDKQGLPFWIILLVIPPGIIVIWLFIRSSKKKKIIQTSVPEPVDDSSMVYPGTKEKRNAIFFFGGFQVFDRVGTDITNKFTPLLKELFLLIILHSLKNEKGISSERIYEILWSDKSPRSASNNLSVNVTKLKNILKNIDCCDLTHETGYWKIHQKKGIFNDYCEVNTIVGSKDTPAQQTINWLIQITNKGPFLVNLSLEWLDVFKARICDKITDFLISYAESLDVKENAELIIEIADCIFNFDIVNEEIMVLKCRAQYGQGRHSLAQNSYQNFCNEYRILYGEEYPQSFTDIINDGN